MSKTFSHIQRGWREIGGQRIYFRSKWEANIARYFEFMKIRKQIRSWEHEPETFWFLNIKRGCRSYLPDFKITENDGTHIWIEVKGHLDQKSKTKLSRFAKYYPHEKLRVFDKEWFSKNSAKLKRLIREWE